MYNQLAQGLIFVNLLFDALLIIGTCFVLKKEQYIKYIFLIVGKPYLNSQLEVENQNMCRFYYRVYRIDQLTLDRVYIATKFQKIADN